MSCSRRRSGSFVLEMVVDGRRRSGQAEPRTLLSDFLRHELKLTETHVGCEQGACGACAVTVDGTLTLACTTLAVQAEQATIETVASIGANGQLSPLQEAFRAQHGLQCGFCTPGVLMAARALLAENPDPSEAEIREHLAGNLCRCTGYAGIVRAVQQAARDDLPVQGSD